jgi:hypothetical protein
MNKLKSFFGKNTNKELKQISLLLTQVFNKEFNFDYLKWLYKDNPSGHAITFNISKNKKIVGHYAVIPTKIKINNKIYKAALSLNTAVDNEFRGKGFFKLMADETFRKCIKKKIKFIFGVSNYQSTRLFEKYFKFQNFGELDIFVSFGNVKRKKVKEKFNVEWRAKDLKWRLKNPKENYIIHNSFDERAYINKKLFKVANINMGQFEKELLLKSKKNITNISLFNIYIGLGQYHDKKKFNIKFPRILKPSPLNFILKNLTKKNNNFKLKREDIFFQLIDFDAF